MFTATRDVEISLESDSQVSESDVLGSNTQVPVQQHTPQRTMDMLRKRIISSLAERDGISLIAHKRAQFWTPDHDVRAACTISKRYDRGSNYWYAYLPQWDEFLSGGYIGYFVLGCFEKEVAYVLPHAEISEHLPNLNTSTNRDGRTYWHIHLEDDQETGMSLILRGEGRRQSIAGFEMRLD